MNVKFKNLVKRLSLKSTLVAMLFCAASAVGYDAYRDATMTEQERMIQANLEALTTDEENDLVPWIRTCYAYGYLGGDDNFVCEGQTENDPPEQCILVAWYNGHDDYKRECKL